MTSSLQTAIVCPCGGGDAFFGIPIPVVHFQNAGLTPAHLDRMYHGAVAAILQRYEPAVRRLVAVACFIGFAYSLLWAFWCGRCDRLTSAYPFVGVLRYWKDEFWDWSRFETVEEILEVRFWQSSMAMLSEELSDSRPFYS